MNKKKKGMKRTVFLLFRFRISKDYPEVAFGLYTRTRPRIFLCVPINAAKTWIFIPKTVSVVAAVYIM